MNMWRRISSKPRKQVALRLYRILDKRFYRKAYVNFDVARLCQGTLGVSTDYAPSQMIRVISRASDWLVQCGFLREVRFQTAATGKAEAVFIKANARESAKRGNATVSKSASSDELSNYLGSLSIEQQENLLRIALSYCKKNKRELFDGYHRTESQPGDVFESYREQVIRSYLVHRKKEQAKAA